MNNVQLGKFAKHLVSKEFKIYGCRVSEYKSRLNDLTIKAGIDSYFDVQIRSIQLSKSKYPYIFFYKHHFYPRANLLAVIVILRYGIDPSLYLIPSTVWKSPNDVFLSKDYENKESNPWWGIQLIDNRMNRLDPFTFKLQVEKLFERTPL